MTLAERGIVPKITQQSFFTSFERKSGYSYGKQRDFPTLIQQISKLWKPDLTQSFSEDGINQALTKITNQQQLELLDQRLTQAVFQEGIVRLTGSLYDFFNRGSGQYYSSQEIQNDLYFSSLKEQQDILTGQTFYQGTNGEILPQPVSYIVDPDTNKLREVFFALVPRSREEVLKFIEQVNGTLTHTEADVKGTIFVPMNEEIEVLVQEGISSFNEEYKDGAIRWQLTTLPVDSRTLSQLVDQTTNNRITSLYPTLPAERTAQSETTQSTVQTRLRIPDEVQIKEEDIIEGQSTRQEVVNRQEQKVIKAETGHKIDREQGLERYWHEPGRQAAIITNTMNYLVSRLGKLPHMETRNSVQLMKSSLQTLFFKELAFHTNRRRDPKSPLLPPIATLAFLMRTLQQNGHIVTEKHRTSEQREIDNFGISHRMVQRRDNADPIADTVIMPDGVIMRQRAIDALTLYVSDADSSEDITNRINSAALLKNLIPDHFNKMSKLIIFTANNLAEEARNAILLATKNEEVLVSGLQIQYLNLPYNRQEPFQEIWGDLVDELIKAHIAFQDMQFAQEEINLAQQQPEKNPLTTMLLVGGFRGIPQGQGRIKPESEIFTSDYYHIFQKELAKSGRVRTMTEEYNHDGIPDQTLPIKNVYAAYDRVLTQGLTREEWSEFLQTIRSGIFEIAQHQHNYSNNLLGRVIKQLGKERKRTKEDSLILGVPVPRLMQSHAQKIIKEHFAGDETIGVTGSGAFYPEFLPYATEAILAALTKYEGSAEQLSEHTILPDKLCAEFAWEDFIYKAFNINIADVDTEDRDSLYGSVRLITDLFTLEEMQQLLQPQPYHISTAQYESELAESIKKANTEKGKSRRRGEGTPLQDAHAALLAEKQKQSHAIKQAIQDIIIRKLPQKESEWEKFLHEQQVSENTYHERGDSALPLTEADFFSETNSITTTQAYKRFTQLLEAGQLIMKYARPL